MLVKKYIDGVAYDLTTEELVQIKMAQERAEAEYWASIPYEEAVNARIRERYTESQEFAILRQRDEKPEEFAKYFAYCEECKAFVKSKQ